MVRGFDRGGVLSLSSEVSDLVTSAIELISPRKFAMRVGMGYALALCLVRSGDIPRVQCGSRRRINSVCSALVGCCCCRLESLGARLGRRLRPWFVGSSSGACPRSMRGR